RRLGSAPYGIGAVWDWRGLGLARLGLGAFRTGAVWDWRPLELSAVSLLRRSPRFATPQRPSQRAGTQRPPPATPRAESVPRLEVARSAPGRRVRPGP